MKRWLTIFIFLLAAAVVQGAPFLGDYVEDETIHFIWSSNAQNGASITRSTNGTVIVYKDNSTTSTAGITDTEDKGGFTGLHACTIDLSADAFYATSANYTVILTGATIDTRVVNAVLGHFSIQNRYMRGTDSAALAATALSNVTWTAAKAAMIDTTVSTRAAAATALTNATWTDARAGYLDRVDTTTSSRLATAGYTAPNNSGITDIKTKTDFLPSATAGAAGGVFIAGSNAATTVNFTGNLSGSVGSVTGAVGSVTGAVGSVTNPVTAGTVSDKTGYSIADSTSDAVIADAVWNALTASYGSANTYGAWVEGLLASSGYTAPDNASIAAILVDTNELQTNQNWNVWDDTTRTLTALDEDNTTIDLNGTAVGSVAGAVGSVTGAVGSVTAGVTVATNNDKTSYTLTAADKATVVDLVWDELQSGHTTLNTFGYFLDSRVSTAGGGALTAEDIRIEMDANSTRLSSISTTSTAIKAKTDNLPASPAAVGSAMTLANDSITSATIAAGAVNVSEAPNLDAAISTRAAASDWTPTRAAYLDRIDTTTSSRLAAADYNELGGDATASNQTEILDELSTVTLILQSR